MLGENKGINLPGIPVKVPSLTEKDEEDLIFAVGEGVDAVAVSFVRTADDVRHVRRRLDAVKSDCWIIAKLEKPQAVEHLDSILEVADAIMVARGDLGVEVPPEKVPAIQKHIIRRAAEYRKPVITATQMLESMIENPRPTRAEASDVANAIYDGTDAVMLSGETAAGKYPVQTVAMMAKIVAETEHQIRLDPPPNRNAKQTTRLSVAETICECMAHSAVDLELSAIAIFTETGSTARLLSKYHPEPPIFALSPYQKVVNRGMLLWGTFPILCERFRDTDKLVDMAERDPGVAWVCSSQPDCGHCCRDADQVRRDELHAPAHDRRSRNWREACEEADSGDKEGHPAGQAQKEVETTRFINPSRSRQCSDRDGFSAALCGLQSMHGAHPSTFRPGG